MQNKAKPETIISYTIGFVASIILTLVPYVIVTQHLLQGWNLIITICVIACIQLYVQLFFFLHLGRGPGRRWNLIVFFFMLLVVLIVVTGSLWIMNNLNYNMLSPDEMNSRMLIEANKGF